MKRFWDWFTKWRIEEQIAMILAFIVALAVGILEFASIDVVPATVTDYAELENQMTAIQKNPDLLLKTDCEISIKDEVITVCFQNDQCSLTVQYNQDFEVLSTFQKDGFTFWLWALIIAVMCGIFIYCVGMILLIIVIYLLEALWERIILIYRTLKLRI